MEKSFLELLRAINGLIHAMMSPPSGLLTRKRQSAQISASLTTVCRSPDFRTGTWGAQTLFNRDPQARSYENNWKNKRKTLHSHRLEENDSGSELPFQKAFKRFSPSGRRDTHHTELPPTMGTTCFMPTGYFWRAGDGDAAAADRNRRRPGGGRRPKQ